MVVGYNIRDAKRFFHSIVQSSVETLQLEPHRPTEEYISGMLTRFIQIKSFASDGPQPVYSDDIVTISENGDIYLFTTGYFRGNLIRQNKLELFMLLGRKAYGSRVDELKSAAGDYKRESVENLRDVCYRLYHAFERYSSVVRHVRLNIDSKSNPVGLFWEYIETKDPDVLTYLYKVYTPEELIRMIDLPRTLLDIF
jgi:hypothetical protein